MRLILAAIVFLLGAGPVMAVEGAGNRLAGTANPYLALHVDDPVHWRVWGPEALAEARRDGKLIFLSIGYFACHWCHVMQRDNFKNPETAALMNASFVNILVDREKHPDVDSTFMKAAGLIGLPTGWPLNLVLTPDAKPIHGGTYFPPEARQGMPGFTKMLIFVARAYAEDPAGISARAAANFALLAQLYYLTGDDRYRAAAARIVGAFRDAPIRDPVHHGGLLRAADTLNGAVQVVVVANREEPMAVAMLREVWRTSLPGRALNVIANGAALPQSHPAFGKTQIDGAPTAYVCVGTFCSLPVQSPSALKKSMREIRRTAAVTRGG